MLFYFILFVFVVALLFSGDDTKYYKYNLAFLIIIFFSIFRFDVGHDYPSYYNLLWPEYDTEAIRIMEPLSACLVKLAHYSGGPLFVFIIFGLLTYFFIYRTIERVSYRNWAFFTYLIFSWISSLGELRQALAVSIVFYSYSFIKEKRVVIYILFCILASLFHISALISILFYPLYYYGSKYMLLTITVFAFLIYNLVSARFIEYGFYASHFENTLGSTSGDKMKFFYVFFYLLMLVLYEYRKKYIIPEVGRVLSIIYLSLLFYFLIDAPLFAYRMNYYFIIFYSFVVPQIIVKCPKGIQYSIFFLMLLFFFLGLYISSLNPSRSPFIPYNMIFFMDDYPVFRGL